MLFSSSWAFDVLCRLFCYSFSLIGHYIVVDNWWSYLVIVVSGVLRHCFGLSVVPYAHIEAFLHTRERSVWFANDSTLVVVLPSPPKKSGSCRVSKSRS